MIKSLIFDFDGTLGDTRANIVLTMTQTLKTMGYPVAGENEIASSRMSGSLNGFLNNMGISDLISYVVGADNVTFAKPHPEPVLKTLEALGVPPSEAMVIGDMPVDIIMGRQAGVKTCGVTYGNSSRKDLEEAGADYIIDDFPSLPDLLI